MHGAEKERAKKEEERGYYEPVRAGLEKLLSPLFDEVHLEVTAGARFSNKLKSEIPQGWDILFRFLKEAPPDLTGFLRRRRREDYVTEFIVAEIKVGRLRLGDIYQAKKYAELFGARYALLVSPQEIPEELKRLHEVRSILTSDVWDVTLCRIDRATGNFIDWFPDEPFMETARLHRMFSEEQEEL